MKRANQHQVAVIVPLSNQTELTPIEQISLRHLLHFLGHYDIFLLAPPGTNIAVAGLPIIRFPKRYFGSGKAHARLMLSRQLYARFQRYEYILLHHLDALVFSDQLAEWCAAGYDYIGAPWLRVPNQPEHGFAGVGNGGFSLRRVQSFLKVLDSTEYMIDPKRYDQQWEALFGQRPLPQRLLNAPRRLLKRLRPLNGVRQFIDRYTLNEDHFWADEAQHYYSGWRVAPTDVALRFAFEEAPRHSYALTGQLPFGCHGWPKNDPDFWQPFLLDEHRMVAK